MRKLQINIRRLILSLLGGPLLLFGLWQEVVDHQDHKLSGIVDYKAGHTQKAISELQDYLKDYPCTDDPSVPIPPYTVP